jgi:hypothetical protein
MVNFARTELAHALRGHGEIDEAGALYREALRAWQHLGQRGAVAAQLENLAYVALDLGQAARAARLLGAAESLREVSGAARVVHFQAENERAVDKLRGQLPTAERETAWAAGKLMDWDEAINYALEELP